MEEKMGTLGKAILVGSFCGLLALSGSAYASVSAQQAEQLRTTLTPLGAEKAGSKDGLIPAWTGGYTTPVPGFVNGGKRPDPFAADKPLYSIAAKNMAQYADKLTEGTQALIKKYPDFRIEVYPSRRTSAAPQWVYDNTFKNATRAKLNGYTLENAYGGIAFPIPQNGLQVMWNTLVRWRPPSLFNTFTGIMGTADGQHVVLNVGRNDQQMPYYNPKGSLETYNGQYWAVRTVNTGPPIRVGEGLVGIKANDPDKGMTWTYLPGQRRVRRLPISCCDTPTPFSGGISTFDEVDVFGGADSLVPFTWTILGKKELFIPYNSNKTLAPSLDKVLSKRFLSPDHVRWELHRVWVVEAKLRSGYRDTSPRSIYYVDEDTWTAVLADRYDANGQLWRTLWTIPIAAPDVPATMNTTWGFYNLLDGSFYANVLLNGQSVQDKIMPYYPARVFSPEALAGEGVY
jgi:hypothetical protein